MAKEKPPRHRVGAASKQEIEPPGSMDDRPARAPEENVGGLFPETAIVFRLCLSFSEFRHAFVSEGVPSAVGDDDVVQERNLKQVQSLLQGLRSLDV